VGRALLSAGINLGLVYAKKKEREKRVPPRARKERFFKKRKENPQVFIHSKIMPSFNTIRHIFD